MENSNSSSSSDSGEYIPYNNFINSNLLLEESNPHERIMRRVNLRPTNRPARFTPNDYQSIIERVLPRGRRRIFNLEHDHEINSDCDVLNENNNNNEEYIDFRIYPLNLDWKDVENEDTIAYNILKIYGHLGLACYTNMIRFIAVDNITYNKFFYLLVEKFLALLDKREKGDLDQFMRSMPNLLKIRELKHKNILRQNDILSAKIIIDLHELYYRETDLPFFRNYLKELIPTTKSFYSLLNKEDVKYIHSIYNTHFNDLKLRNVSLFNKKRHYLIFYKELKAQLIISKSGLSNKSFII